MNIKKGFLALSLSATMLTGFVSEGNVSAANDGMTRGEFVQAVVSELQISPKNQNILLPTDVKKDSPYANSVKVLKERKVISGYPDGSFHPDQPIKKQEVFIILSKILGISLDQAEKTFKDEYGLILNTDTLTSDQATRAIQQALQSSAEAYDWVKQSSEVYQKQSSFRSNVSQDIKMILSENIPEMNNSNTMTMSSDVKMDFHVDKGIHMTMTTSLGETLPNGQSEMEMEQYITPEGMFMSMPNPETGEVEWIKMDEAMPFSFQQLMDIQKNSAGANQALLENKHVFYRDLGSETLNDSKVHKVEFRSRFTSFEEMMAVMGQSLPEDLQQQLGEVPFTGDLSLSGVMWFDEKTKLPVKFSQEMTFNYGPSNDEQPIEQMLLKQTGTYYDYNQIKDISLPEAAKNAKPLTLPSVDN